MKKRKFTFIQVILGILIIGIAVSMWMHVSSAKEELENIQTDLIYVEAGRMKREDAKYLRGDHGYAYESSNAIHPESAYVFAIPYVMIDVALIILYIVKYRT